MKKILILFAVIILIYGIIIKFSLVETRYECVGTISTTDGKKPLTVYLKLETYRWWVGLWSESYGELHTEIPNSRIDYFSDLKKVGDKYFIFDYEMDIKGNFSTLSNTLSLQLPFENKTDYFDGKCNIIN